MRWIVGIALLLFATGWLACEFKAPAEAVASRLLVSEWRRTVNGWERLVPVAIATNAQFDALTESHPHPIILSLLEGMVSVLVLVAFSSDAVPVRDAGEPKKSVAETDTPTEDNLSP